MEALCSRSNSASNLSSITRSPSRNTIVPKIRLCASVSQEDHENNNCHVTDHHLQIGAKTYSRSIFDHIFKPEASQDELYSNFLGEMIKSVIGGNDATIVAMGAKSNGKDERLYGDSVSRNGLMQMAIAELMSMLEELRTPDERVQVRMSAIMVSQNDSSIVDLLSPFNPDPRHRVVKIVDDPRSGVFLDNESEIRIDSVDQALFYLNTVADHRLVQDELTNRTSHAFISLSLYSYRMTEKQMQGGRRRLSFLDMGIGERNSQNGGMTMPSLGSILLAMVQRNKHVPFRDTSICQLIRCALSSPSSRLNTFLFSFGRRDDDNQNIAHLACKLARAAGTMATRLKAVVNGSRRTLAQSEQGTSTSSAETRGRLSGRELESGSELSAAETVIFLGAPPQTGAGAMVNGSSRNASPSKPPLGRALHRTKRHSKEEDTDLTIPLTIDTKSSSPTHSCQSSCIHSIPPMLKGHTPFLSASLKLYDELCSPPGTSRGSVGAASPSAFGGVTAENRDDFGITIAATPPHSTTSSSNMKSKSSRYNLDDGKRQQIMEWMENSDVPPILFTNTCYDEVKEALGGILSHPLEDIIEQEEESLRTSTATTSKGEHDHPLRILSKQNLVEKVDSQASVNKDRKDDSENSDELELVMAASLSSMKSHDILAKLEAMRNNHGVSMSTELSEMDVYRRASHLEEYAMQRVKEIEETKKKKKIKMGLNCCQQSMVSSGSTVVDWSQIERKREQEKAALEEEQRKEALRQRRAKLKITELEIKKERSLITKELDDKRGLANTIARQLQHFSLSPCRSSAGKGSQRSMSHHRIDPPMVSLPSTPTMSSHRKGSNLTNGSISSLPRPSRKNSSSRTRRKEELNWRSPYANMTSPKTYGGPGTSSSGRGSSAPGSDFDTTGVSAGTNGSSVAAGGNTLPASKKRQSYSASSGYESASNDYHTFAKQTLFSKRAAANEERMNFTRKSDEIRHRQRQLKRELEEAKHAIGQVEDARSIASGVNDCQRLNGLTRTTLIDTLMQENRILEKRLMACRNHAMLVTTFI